MYIYSILCSLLIIQSVMIFDLSSERSSSTNVRRGPRGASSPCESADFRRAREVLHDFESDSYEGARLVVFLYSCCLLFFYCFPHLSQWRRLGYTTGLTILLWRASPYMLNGFYLGVKLIEFATVIHILSQDSPWLVINRGALNFSDP